MLSDNNMNLYLTLSCLIIFVLLYFVMAQFFTHRRFNYLQETSIAIIVGVCVGICFFFLTDFFNDNSQSNSQSFIRDMIFLILLPPIMFEDGYNFPRRKFFQNFLYINLYGLLGTILNFFIIWGILYGANSASLFVSVSDAQEIITLNNWQILLIAAALSSIEPVVTEKVVDKETHPKLFSIIFGESLFKDTLSITMFDSIRDLVANTDIVNYDIVGADVGLLLLKFLEVVVCSILIGVGVGLLVTLIFKNMRFLLKEKGISQMAITILGGFLSYVLSEWADLSGVISMLFCGTVLAHYNTYNLTEEGKSSTLVAIEVLKIGASGVIFFFIGFEIFNVQSFQSAIDGATKSSFSATLLGFTFLALFIGRIISVFLVTLLGWLLVKKENWRLNVYEYWIIFMAGLVHGAVPFALSATLPMSTLTTSNCTQLDIVAVVIITSLFVNMIIPKIEKYLLGKIRTLEKNDPNHPSVKLSFAPKSQKSIKNYPSVVDGEAPLLDKFKSTTQKYWRKFDEGIVKPFLIYNYIIRRDEIKLQKMKRRMEEHQRYLQRYPNASNILSENEDLNVFYQVSNSAHSSSGKEDKVVKYRLSNEHTRKAKKELPKIQRQRSQGNSSAYDKKIHSDTEGQLRKKSKKKAEIERRRPTETQIVSIQSMKGGQKSQEGQIELKIQPKEQEKGL